jgi:hypothetical protein
MVYIYILKLEQNKYYVGKTTNPDRRLLEHNNSQGASWTKMYKPIEVIKIIPDCSNFDEDKYTLEYMNLYGIDNVRGGSFCTIFLSNIVKCTIQRMLNGGTDKCFTCGKAGHFSNKCRYNQNNINQGHNKLSRQEILKIMEMNRNNKIPMLAPIITEPIQAPVQKPIAEVVQKPIAEVVQKPIAQVVQKPIAEVVQKPIAQVVQKPIAQVVQKPIAQVIQKPIAQVVNIPRLKKSIFDELDDEDSEDYFGASLFTSAIAEPVKKQIIAVNVPNVKKSLFDDLDDDEGYFGAPLVKPVKVKPPVAPKPIVAHTVSHKSPVAPKPPVTPKPTVVNDKDIQPVINKIKIPSIFTQNNTQLPISFPKPVLNSNTDNPVTKPIPKPKPKLNEPKVDNINTSSVVFTEPLPAPQYKPTSTVVFTEPPPVVYRPLVPGSNILHLIPPPPVPTYSSQPANNNNFDMPGFLGAFKYLLDQDKQNNNLNNANIMMKIIDEKEKQQIKIDMPEDMLKEILAAQEKAKAQEKPKRKQTFYDYDY